MTVSQIKASEIQKAAVLVLSYEEKGEEHFVLTRRTEEVLHHKGQICFPGGALDPEDKSLWETALREGREEIGLDPSQVTLIRELASYPTPSGFLVTPFLASFSGSPAWVPNPHECAEVFGVPLSHLKEEKNRKFEKQIWNGHAFYNPHFQYGPHVIWGVTGRILCEVLKIDIPAA